MVKPDLKHYRLKRGKELPESQQKPDGTNTEAEKTPIAEVDAVSKAAAKVADTYDADVFLYNGTIDESGLGDLVESVFYSAERTNALLILVTYGGSANSAYRIARFLQKNYEELIVFIPSYCKSAGTLVTLGASRLIMSDFGEIGPLDVQLFKQDELGERKSGLLSKSSFDALSDSMFRMFEDFMIKIKHKSFGLISFQKASDIAASMSSSAMQPVFAQLNPNIIGDDHRDLSVALQYGLRLIIYGGNASHDSVNKLVNGYPAHDFVIDREEAKSLFFNVETPSLDLYNLLQEITDVAYQPNDEHTDVRLLSPGKEVPVEKTHGNEEDSDDQTSSKKAVQTDE